MIDPTGLYDVMVSYIANKNSGSATYSEKNIAGIGGWDKKVEVTMNGTTKTYTIGKKDSAVRIVEGKSVIDHSVLMNDFGLTESQSTHLAGDKFDSEKHAVMAFGMMYHQRSKNEQQEYGASIEKNSDGTYGFANVVWSFKDGNTQDNMSVNLSITNNSVGVIHTHWHPRGSLSFSPGDTEAAKNLLNNGRPLNWYLINRNAEVKRMTPNSKKTGYNNAKTWFKIK